MTAFARHRDSANIFDLIAAPDNAGHRPFIVPATTFKLNFIERDPEPPWTDLLGISATLEIDIAKSDIVGLIADRAPTGLNRPALKLAIVLAIMAITILAVPISAIGAVADRAIAAIANIQIQGPIAGLQGQAAFDILARLAVIGEGWSSEEQRRRQG